MRNQNFHIKNTKLQIQMKQITLLLITILFSCCSGMKKETTDIDDVYKLLIHEFIVLLPEGILT